MSFRKKITVLRTIGGYFDNDGMWNDGTSEEITIFASVQPLNYDEKAQYSTLAPEGATEYSAVKLYSNVALKPAKQALDGSTMQEADVVLWRGRQYKVVLCEDWQSDVINHYHMVAWEIEPKEVEPDEDNDTEVSP